MTDNYTSNNLIRFIYGEPSLNEYADLDDKMIADPALRVSFKHLYDAHQLLNTSMLSPSKSSIDNIIQYSRS